MDVMLSGLQWETCLVYLDDVLIFGRTHEEMLNRLDNVHRRLQSGGMKLRLDKCKFSQRQVTYLGHVISVDGIRPDPLKIHAVQNMPDPTNVKEVKSFLGLVSYYRRFIANCSQIAAPLTKLLKKGEIFRWSPDQQTSFNDLKQALISEPILIHPNFDRPFIIQTDSSYCGIGAVLSQISDDGKEHPVAFASRTLKPAEVNYPITELETLAVVEFVKYFRPYLYQQTVRVVTDHTAVKAVLLKENPNPRIARWGFALSGFTLDIVPRKGLKNANADALSRIPVNDLTIDYNIDTAKFADRKGTQ